MIEKVSSATYNEILEKDILQPVGMFDTKLFSEGELLSNRAIGYQHSEVESGFLRATGEPAGYAGGGLYTTVLDLLLFDQVLYGEDLLTNATKELMFTPVQPSRHYGYGWIVVPFGGANAIYHGGRSDGFNAQLRRYPDTGYTVIVLSNYHGDSSFELANKIDCMLLGYPYSLATKYDLNFRLGNYYKNEKGDYRKAITFYNKNLNTSEMHLPSLYESASARLHGEFDQDKAIALFDQYLELVGEDAHPSIATVWARKGGAYEQLKNSKKAVQCYKKSLKLDPNLGWVKKALERLEE
jgi:CubicO group peptidase (beta-lactamase class C family)